MKLKVDSIAEYLKLIEKHKLSNYIFRGQNEPYWGIQASGFRPYKGSWTTDKFYNINKMIKDYHDKVIRRLSLEEQKHFVAFSQHHGLPTNLVDFTYSPLIALYFACSGKSSPSFTLEDLINKNTYDVIDELVKDESLQKMLVHNIVNMVNKECFSPYSEVYLIDKRRLIDISEIMVQYQNENLFDLLDEDKSVQTWICRELESKFKKYPQFINVWIKGILSNYIDNKLTIPDGINQSGQLSSKRINNELSKYRKNIEKDSFDGEIFQDLFVFLMNEIYDETITHGEMYYLDEWQIKSAGREALAARIYMALLINLIQTIYSSHIKVELNLDVYFSYHPPSLFDRISNQKGMFINQSYVYSVDDSYSYGNLVYQSIRPDIVIEIDNYTKVLEELNFIGINPESIYSDLDSIAQAVKHDHNQLLHD